MLDNITLALGDIDTSKVFLTNGFQMDIHQMAQGLFWGDSFGRKTYIPFF